MNRFANRVSRRRFLGSSGLAGAGLASMMVVGCGDDDDDDDDSGSQGPSGSPAASAPAGQPKRGGTLVRAHNTDTEHMDPALDTSNLMHFGSGQLYAKLLRWDASAENLLPDLAEGLPEVSGDGLQYIYKLRPGLKFSDGSPLTSRDVAYTYLRIASPDLKSPHQYKAGPLDSVDTPDDTTVVFKLKSPFVPFVDFSGSAWMYILSERWVEEKGPKFQEALSSGPFYITDRKPGVSTRFERNPHYYDPERPYPDAIDFRVVADQAAIDAAVISENADYVGSVFDKARLDTLLGGNSKLNDYKYAVRHAQLFLFNCQSGPFVDPRLRRAVSMLIDRQLYTAVVLSTGGQPSGPVPWAFETYALTPDELSKQPGYRKNKDEDIKEAKALLEAAGKGDGFTVRAPTLAGPSPFNSQSVALKAQLQEFGIDLQLEIVDFPGLNQLRASGDFDAHAYINGGSQVIDEAIYGPNYTGQARNVNRFSDPEIDKLLDKTRTELDEDARVELIRDIQLKLLEAQPTAWLADPYYHTVASPRLAGYQGAKVFDWASELHDVYIDENAKGGQRIEL